VPGAAVVAPPRARSKFALVLATLAGLLAAGMVGVWSLASRLNEGGLEADFRHLADKGRLPPKDVAAAMAASSRAGTVVFRAAGADVESFARALGLVEVRDPAADRALLGIEAEPLGRGRCQELGLVRVRVWRSEDPARLACPDGSAFAYLVLYQSMDGEQVVAQLAYRYG
jgi:hypothetical protein